LHFIGIVMYGNKQNDEAIYLGMVLV